ncbi:phosphoribosyl-AMP cyclohydrolase [Granulosicoccaceae sp. 1_MG-2023]|nr:phosphoribosyl-AMP cyclohydrolase [Granulosicoccaceae sp. 1_MG-2023]
MTTEAWMADLRWNEQGLIPVIAQDWQDKTILMMAWMNAEALALTVETGKVVYYSRSRQGLWRKGETSGNEQILHALKLDCDSDVLLVEVEQRGDVACHTGRRSCFYKTLDAGKQWQINQPVLKDPDEMYGKKS